MKCDRCQRETNTYSGSWFNTQMICQQCQLLEREHPLFKKAKEVEHREVMKGNTNFQGIGLPKDLEIVSRIADDIPLDTKAQPLNKDQETDLRNWVFQVGKEKK